MRGKRWAGWAAALLALGMLAGCGQPAAPQQPGEEAAGAQVAYPALVGGQLAGSALYQQMSARQEAVLLYNGQVLTSAAAAREFVAQYEAGQPAGLMVCHFFDDGRGQSHRALVYELAVPEEGVPYRRFYRPQGGQAQGEDPWGLLWQPAEEKYAIEGLQLNEYGILLLDDHSSSIPTGVQVVNSREIYPDYERLKQAEEAYLQPLAYDLAAGLTFENPGQLTNLMGLFDDLYCFEHRAENGNLWQQYPEGRIPVGEVCSLLSRYFDLPAGQLEQMLVGTAGHRYTVEEGNIVYPGGRGGVGPVLRCLSLQEEAGQAAIGYCLCDRVTMEPLAQYRMIVRLEEDGGFRYQSILQEDPS